MDASFIPIEVVPSKTPFGLDQLRRSYKTALSATAAITAAPSVSTADETFPNMFLMPISTPESAESATRIDLVYMGSFGGAAGSPVLPSQKHDDADQVQSASSSMGSSGQKVTSPVTVQFYAPTSILTWFTFGAKGTKGTAPDPDRSIEIITVTSGDTAFSYGSIGIAGLVSGFFTETVVSSFDATEIVPGHYWQNTEHRTRVYTPFITNLPPGFYPQPYASGTGYTVLDTITVTASGSCVMTVTGVGTGGEIFGTTIVSNTLSAATTTPISATGGTGSGAKYTVIHVT